MKITLNNQHIVLTPNIQLSELRQQNANATWWNSIVDFLEEWTSNKLTITVKTSGSTGEPKVWEIEKVKFWVSATKTCEFFELNNKSTGLLCLSANYIAGKMMLVRALVSGMNLLCVEPKNSPLNYLHEAIDFCAMVPMQVKSCLNEPKKLNQIKNLIIGGGQVDFSLQNQLKAYKGNAYETFGMTETLSHVALRKVSPISENHFSALSGVSILQGYNNTLIIDYPELGIYKLKTNDIIELKGTSGHFIWKGRTDFIINSGGVKISPEEVEKQIAHLIKQRFCIIGLKDEKLGEKVVLALEGEKFNTSILNEELKKYLSPYTCPKEIMFIKEFPLTNNGKIKRKELFEMIS